MTDDDGDDGTGESTEQRAPTSDDRTAVSPDFEAEFPSVTAGSDATGSPSASVDETDTDAPDGEGVSPVKAAEESGGGLGWPGWVLVGGLVVAMVLVPWAIVFLPAIQGALGSLGLGLRDAYLVLPMIPAVGLGVLAVWAAVAYRRRET